MNAFGKIVIAIVIFFALYTWHMTGRMGYFTGGRTTSMEVVDIMLDGEVHLRIPKAYLTEKRNWKGGDQEVVAIKAVLPNMQPYSLAKKNPLDAGQRVVSITLYSGTKKANSESLYQKEYRNIKKYLLPLRYGMMKVDPKIFDDKKNNLIQTTGLFSHDYNYYFADNSERNARISCEKRPDIKPKNGGCRAWTNFNKHLTGNYSAAVSNREDISDDWPVIDANVVDLVNSFVVN